jgi:hypothetical protein
MCLKDTGKIINEFVLGSCLFYQNEIKYIGHPECKDTKAIKFLKNIY